MGTDQIHTEGEVAAADRRWMQRALRLARKGWGTTSPNPMVGAVIVRRNQVVGEGFHRRAGELHAEIHALRAADRRARGATLYVTLEPCSSHGRTPPCVDAIVKAGIATVVMATPDPDVRHRGRAVKMLRQNGIDVRVDVDRDAAQDLNAAFFCRALAGRPLVLLKMAMTLDGRIATRDGQSQWITGPAARRQVQRYRRWADAILVGGETIRRDNPQLLVREPRNWPRQPLRLVASRAGNLGRAPRVLTDGRAATRIVAFDTAAQLEELLLQLGREGIAALLVEGGGELAAALLAAGCVDQVAFFIAPILLGGRNSRPVIGGNDPVSLADGRRLANVNVRRIGADTLITGNLTDVHRYC